MIPAYVTREARTFARESVRQGLAAIFGDEGLIDRELDRVRSAAYALERSRFHARMTDALPLLGGVPRWRIRWHERRAMRFAALAVARDPRLADHCSLRECR